MTYAQAVSLRAAQLAGGLVHPVALAEALWIIREGAKGRRPFSQARRLIDDEQVRLLELAVRPTA